MDTARRIETDTVLIASRIERGLAYFLFLHVQILCIPLPARFVFPCSNLTLHAPMEHRSWNEFGWLIEANTAYCALQRARALTRCPYPINGSYLSPVSFFSSNHQPTFAHSTKGFPYRKVRQDHSDNGTRNSSFFFFRIQSVDAAIFHRRLSFILTAIAFP